MKHVRQIVLPLLLVVLAQHGLASEPPPLRVTITPATGRFYRPHAWTLLHADLELPTSGVYTPTMHLLTTEGPGTFASSLPPQKLTAGVVRLSFWIAPPSTAPAISLVLVSATPNTPTLRSSLLPNQIEPLQANQRLLVTTSSATPVIDKTRFASVHPDNLPEHAALYESCNVIILGNISGRPAAPLPRRRQYDALAQWIANGGVLLLLDTHIGAPLWKAVERNGWHMTRGTPFYLPPQQRQRALQQPPLARRIGRGFVVELHSASATHERILAGKRVWDRLSRETLAHANTDPSYRPLLCQGRPTDFPKAPQMHPSAIAKWTLAWLAITLALLGTIWMRKHTWCVPLAIALVSIATAVVLIQHNPVPTQTLLHVRTHVADDTGHFQPSRTESFWFTRPFSPKIPIRIPFSHFPPPRLLTASPNQPEQTRTALRLQQDGLHSLTLYPFSSEQGYSKKEGLLFSHAWHDAPIDSIPVTCIESKTGVRLTGKTFPNLLHAPTLRTERGTIRIPKRPAPASAIIPFTQQQQPQTNRARIREILLREHQPGLFAILSAWENPENASTPDDIGTLRIHTLNRVAE